MQKLFLGLLAALLFACSAMAQSFQMPKPTLADPAPEGVRVSAPGVVGNYYPASGAGRYPGILLLGGSEGGLGPGTTRMGKALAAHGFDVLHVAYFGAPDEPEKLVDVPLETFDRGLAWLRVRPEVDGERIGIVGGSKGAEAALLYASRTPAIKAVVAGMPSSVVWPGINYAETMQPSWTVGGKPVPFLPYVFGSDDRNLYSVYDNGLKALDQHPDAVIPVENIGGPVMLIGGKADTLWPSCLMAEQIAARLKAKGFHHEVQLLECEDAGHAVFGVPVEGTNPAYPSLASLGGSADGNAAARADAWPRVLAFLDAVLRH
ncbi:MAG: dienelactone hydrolase [Rhodospirillales bacterium]|nr:dienelactone hydrolase [Acetobacter sp.]